MSYIIRNYRGVMEVFKNYHRVPVLGKELDIREQALVEYMDVALYMVADALSRKAF